MKASTYLVTALIALAGSAAANIDGGGEQTVDIAHSEEWRFVVYLNDREIGHHRFSTGFRDGHKIIKSRASFKVNFWIFNAYEYDHVNNETWKEGCLKKMVSRTNDNGDLYAVTVDTDTDPESLLVDTQDRTRTLNGCIRTFAYWDPDLIKADRLLNSQTGEYIDVETKDLGQSPVQHKGKLVNAKRYRIMARNLSIDVWYSDGGDWLALDSVKDGNRISYRLQ